MEGAVYVKKREKGAKDVANYENIFFNKQDL
jgi:hypothetical protein